MQPQRTAAFALVLLMARLAAQGAATATADWPRFRGPNGQGVAAEGARPPVEFGPNRNLAWKTDLPPGHSSPVVASGRVFLTAYDAGKLETICLDAAGGSVLWRRTAPTEKIEKVNSAHSPAGPTPATDGRRVYVYFGSYGLLAYDLDGKELWKVPVPLPQNMFGTATSPVLAGDNVVLVRDSDAGDSYALAVNCETGKQAWKTPRTLFMGSWSTPMLWGHDGLEELVVLGSGRVVAYDPASGAQRWSVSGFPQQPITTPVVGDGLLFAAKGGQGEPGESFVKDIPKWADLIGKFDKNKDGRLAADEVPGDYGFELRKDVPKGTEGNFLSLRTLIRMIDRDKNGLTRFEWGMANAFVSANEDLMLALRPGGEGDVTETHIAWRQRRGLPELPSPLFYQGRLYLVKNGGVVSCLDPKTGKQVYRERLGATGPYYASPIAADGAIYAASEAGVVSVFKAGETFAALAENDLGERTVATPAIVGDRLYVRTEKHLFAFGGAH
jgi:outer membrane protein assembly factor BamB